MYTYNFYRSDMKLVDNTVVKSWSIEKSKSKYGMYVPDFFLGLGISVRKIFACDERDVSIFSEFVLIFIGFILGLGLGLGLLRFVGGYICSYATTGDINVEVDDMDDDGDGKYTDNSMALT
jgi:hypothetical protein